MAGISHNQSVHTVPIRDERGNEAGDATIERGLIAVKVVLRPRGLKPVPVNLLPPQFANPLAHPLLSGGGEIILDRRGVRFIRPGGTYVIPLEKYNEVLTREGEPPLTVQTLFGSNRELFDRISRGSHWRVWVEPVEALPQNLSGQRLLEIVSECKVTVGGTYVPSPNPKTGYSDLGEGYLESWWDADGNREWWRLDDDGRIQYVRALREDTPSAQQKLLERYGQRLRPGAAMPEKMLSGREIVAMPTEICAFAASLVGRGFFANGFDLTIELHGVKGRGVEMFAAGSKQGERSVAALEHVRFESHVGRMGLSGSGERLAAEAVEKLLSQLQVEFRPETIRLIQADLFKQEAAEH